MSLPTTNQQQEVKEEQRGDEIATKRRGSVIKFMKKRPDLYGEVLASLETSDQLVCDKVEDRLLMNELKKKRGDLFDAVRGRAKTF